MKRFSTEKIGNFIITVITAFISTFFMSSCMGLNKLVNNPDGQIHPTRSEEVPGIHASGYNAHSIGICYEGGYDAKGKVADTRTTEQRAALIALLRSLKEDYPEADIRGHRELKGVHKDCPCFDCQEYRDYFAKLQK